MTTYKLLHSLWENSTCTICGREVFQVAACGCPESYPDNIILITVSCHGEKWKVKIKAEALIGMVTDLSLRIIVPPPDSHILPYMPPDSLA